MHFLSKAYSDIRDYDCMKSTYMAMRPYPCHLKLRYTVPWMGDEQIESSWKTLGRGSDFCDISASQAANHELYLRQVNAIIIVGKGLSRSFRSIGNATLQLVTSLRLIESRLQAIGQIQLEIPTEECLPPSYNVSRSLDMVTQDSTEVEAIPLEVITIGIQTEESRPSCEDCEGCLPSCEDTQESLNMTNRVDRMSTRGKRIYPMVDYVVVQSYPTGVQSDTGTQTPKD